MDMTLDFNTELFPLKNGDHFSFSLASSLSRNPHTNNPDGTTEEDEHIWRPDGKGQRGIEEDYDYVMFGKVCAITKYTVYPINLALGVQVRR